jgi:tetratricopeptide (TPR) repeat protein
LHELFPAAPHRWFHDGAANVEGIMTRAKQLWICATASLIASLIGSPGLAEPLAAKELTDLQKCDDTYKELPPEVVIQGCTGLINSPGLPPIVRDNAFFMRGKTYAALGDDQRAIADFSASIRLKSSGGAYINRAWSYKRLGSYDLAIADFRKAIGPLGGQELYFEIGDIYNIRKQYDKAIATGRGNS